MRKDFENSSPKREFCAFKTITVYPEFADPMHGQGFFDDLFAETVPHLKVSGAGILFNYDNPDLVIRVDARAVYFQIITPGIAETFRESEFYFSDLSPPVLQQINKWATADTHPSEQEEKILFQAIADEVIEKISKVTPYKFNDPVIAADALTPIAEAWFEDEIKHRPENRQTWNLPPVPLAATAQPSQP